jgi:hypothetical protein
MKSVKVLSALDEECEELIMAASHFLQTKFS